jgi:hypothetical protein
MGKRGVKYEHDGYIFDSKLEINHYNLLKKYSVFIEIVDMQKQFTLLEFNDTYIDFPNGKKRKQRDMVYTPDFILKVRGYDKLVAMESKGFPRKDYNIRKKLFIREHGDEYYHYECRSVKQLQEDLDYIMRENTDFVINTPKKGGKK